MNTRNTALPLSRRAVLTGIAAVGVTLTAPGMSRAAGGKVNFYNWDTYIGENTLADFTKATGTEVQYDLFADMDELFAKLKGGNPGYDLIVPSNDYVERMIAADMLVPLDKSKLPNIANIDPIFMEATFDPGRKFSLPYFWGTIGIGYRKSKVSSVPNSWKTVFDSDEYSGRIALMSESQTVLEIAMKYLGWSLNDWTDEHLAAAEELMKKQKPHITAYAPDNGQDLLLAGEVDLAMEWNGDIAQVMAEDDDIGYVVPDEGSVLWQDTLAIPAGGPNPEGAHELINFILDAKVSAEIADFVAYATPNKAAKEFLGEEYLTNEAIFPPDAVVAKCETASYPGLEMARKIDEAWTRVKSAS